jgi:hypothetical protein
MVKQQNTNIARNIDKTTTAYPEHASARQSIQSKRLNADDLIKSLSNAYENQRARQVFEWERSQATNIQRTV